MLPAHEHAAEQQRGIDGGHFGSEGPRARRHVHKMIEEPIHPVRLQLVQHKIESRLHASGDGCARLIAALIADAERRQTESRCRNARHPSCVVSCGERAVLHLSGRRVCLLPEKKIRRLLDLLEQLVVRPGVAVSRQRWRRRCASAAAAIGRSEEHTSELQSLAYLVCRLLLEKKKKIHKTYTHNVTKKNKEKQI